MDSMKVCLNLAEGLLVEVLESPKKIFCKIVDETCERFLGTILFAPEAERIPAPKSQKKKLLPGLALTAKKAKSVIPLATNASSAVVQISTGAATKIDVSSMMTVMQNMSTNEKSYKCSFCGEENKAQSSMKRHIEIKHLPSPDFKCLNCGYSSKLKNNLKRHYMTKHGMPAPAAQGMLLAL